MLLFANTGDNRPDDAASMSYRVTACKGVLRT